MKPCNDCPFIKKTTLNGSPDWLRDVLTFHQQDKFFQHTCHKTDSKAHGYVGGKKKECRGHLQMMFNEMDGTIGKGGVYDSIEQLAKAYFKHWGVELPEQARLKRVDE